jgi:hypothetical protein
MADGFHYPPKVAIGPLNHFERQPFSWCELLTRATTKEFRVIAST